MLASDIRTVAQLRLLPDDSFYVTVNGRIVDWRCLEDGIRFEVHFRLRGGKGGFGSLLRSFRIHRSTNQLMCRDLSGRRLADIKEEERLRKWIENKDEREKEKRRQKQEKYNKLKAGPQKHDFNDPKFIEIREKILDETDEAFEAGIAATRRKRTVEKDVIKSNEKSQAVEEDDLEESTVSVRKKKPVDETVECKKPKLDEECKKSKPDEECKSPVVADKKCNEENKKKETIQETTGSSSSEKSKTVEKKSVKMMEFEEIKLDDYDSAESLELLGLDHLKHALEARGLKCGGTLVERAVRLYSIKGLKPEQYPKNIRAGGKRK